MFIVKNRTKHLLCNALMTLLIEQKRSFESITINEICERAIIHRTTFYTHFADKYALFQYFYRSITEKRKTYSLAERIYEPFRISTELKQVDLLRIATDLTFNSNSMRSFIEPLINEALALDIQKIQQVKNLIIPEQLLISHLRSTLLTVDFYWMQQASHLNATQIDDYYQQLIAPLLGLPKSLLRAW